MLIFVKSKLGMQFKNPELLWALFLLLIPLFIHLFQLRKFKKTPFTNVALLQKVVVKSRKTKNLKKWLLLLTRILLFTAIIIAFAQPFFAKTNALKKKETIIYIDNSFSMQVKENGQSLLQKGVQELLKSIQPNSTFSLFTNTDTYKNVVVEDVQNNLLSLDYSHKQLKLNEILLKSKTLFSKSEATDKNLIVFSDFQQRLQSKTLDTLQNIKTHLVQLEPINIKNIVIDSVFVSKTTPETKELTVNLSSNIAAENIPVSLFNNDTLIAKTAAKFEQGKKASVLFTIPENKKLNGRIAITDSGLNYDNELFFTIAKREKIKVLTISDKPIDFLKKIFTDDEFTLTSSSFNNLNFSTIESQHLIVLNELSSFSNALQTALNSFTQNGGSLLVIPSIDANIPSYNALLNNHSSSTITKKVNGERKVSGITFSHPIYNNVFEKEVTNFQYPTVKNYFDVKTTSTTILRFDNQRPFLIGSDNNYFFTAALEKENSNFINSPLIVPTLYNIGLQSYRLQQLYQVMGKNNTIDVAVSLEKDNILSVSNANTEFIPLQQLYPNKVALTFNDNPTTNGLYTIKKGSQEFGKIGFNYPKKESELTYINLNSIKATSKQKSVTSLFQNLEKDNRVTELWKWFVILALLFALIEMLIQKYLK